jgi:signal peptidase II
MNIFSKYINRVKNRGPKDFVRHLWLPLVIMVAVIFVDLLTKSIIENKIALNQSVVIIPNFLSFTYVQNEGAAFSILEGQRWLFVTLTAIAVIAILLFLIYDCDKLTALMKVALGLIAGGGIGNLVDRLAIGKVRDFIEIYFFGLDLPVLGDSFAIFNIADSGITVGTILLIIGIIIGYQKKEKPGQEKAPEPQD